jgi:hypothetical protein
MSTTFLFEELDPETRDYLLAVRDGKGKESPGVFAPVTNSLPGLGCFAGVGLIAVTLVVTLVPGIGVIFDDPNRVALLQTAGLVLGGWLLLAAVRVWGSQGGKKTAGHWVYADPLHLYEATGERVKVSPLDEVAEAKCEHVSKDGKYQHSTLGIHTAGKKKIVLTLNDEGRASHLTVYLNYLAWARGPEGGGRAALPPATLGGLARYVARNDNEPLDADGNVNLSLIEVGTGEVPEEPRRDRRAIPRVLPYVVVLAAGVVCFFLMVQVNIPLRDDAIFDAVTTNPVEPRYLRAYLLDPRNTRHRDQVYDRLPPFYNRVVDAVRDKGGDESLRTGFIRVLDSLRRADQPVVSIRVVEAKSPAGQEGGAADRVKKLQEGVADRINAEFAKVEPPVQPPPDVVFPSPPPPVGHQLIAFAVMPEDAPNPHFDVRYAFEPADADATTYRVRATVTIRVNVEEGPVATKQLVLPGSYAADQADRAATDLKERIIQDMVGILGNAGGFGPQPGFPGFPKINVP